MIKFRQKVFGKSAKDIVGAVKKSFKENPVGLSLAALGTAGTGVNIALNTKRKNNEKEFYDNQIKSTKSLTRSLKKAYKENDEVLESLKDYHKEHMKTPPKDPTSDYIIAVRSGNKSNRYRLNKNTK